jgi:hypothetical protein
MLADEDEFVYNSIQASSYLSVNRFNKFHNEKTFKRANNRRFTGNLAQ